MMVMDNSMMYAATIRERRLALFERTVQLF